ncbi:hypothetical protein BYT27DRAFT_7333009 [Phlegmacium glaucopus]|nr:hypothetical protein BYT27DRAFT_7333009 [Phlegmacium glaucopus]
MSVPSSADIFTKDEDEERVIQRIDSGETNESPFGSNLATPVDEDAFFHQGIHERLDIAEKIGSYFDTNEIQLGKVKSVLEVDTKAADEFKVERCTVSLSQSESDSLPLSSSDSMRLVTSPEFSSSESIRIPRAGSIYNLPNEHILIESSSNVSKSEVEDSEDDLLEKDDDSASFPTHLHETQSSIAELRLLIKDVTISKLLGLAIRILCFLPWCIAVGGSLVLFPDHLEYIAFQTGYIVSPTGIRRFSHWAEYGMQHVIIFGAFLGLFVFILPTTGFLLIGGLLAQFYHVWNYFSLDRTVPLGTDDLQAVYLLATTHWLNETFPEIKKVDDHYYSLGEFEIEERRRVEKA